MKNDYVSINTTDLKNKMVNYKLLLSLELNAKSMNYENKMYSVIFKKDLVKVNGYKLNTIEKEIRKFKKINVIKTISINDEIAYILNHRENINYIYIEREIAEDIIRFYNSNEIKVYIYLRLNCSNCEELKIARKEIAEGIGMSYKSDLNLKTIGEITKRLKYNNFIKISKKTSVDIHDKVRTNCCYSIVKFEDWIKSETKEPIVIKKTTPIKRKLMYCVYRFLNYENEILYIGKTKDINIRMNTHFGDKGHLGKDKYEQVSRIEYMICDNESDMVVKEIYFINKYKPPFNTQSLCNGEISNLEYDNLTWDYNFNCI